MVISLSQWVYLCEILRWLWAVAVALSARNNDVKKTFVSIWIFSLFTMGHYVVRHLYIYTIPNLYKSKQIRSCTNVCLPSIHSRLLVELCQAFFAPLAQMHSLKAGFHWLFMITQKGLCKCGLQWSAAACFLYSGSLSFIRGEKMSGWHLWLFFFCIRPFFTMKDHVVSWCRSQFTCTC